MGHVSGGGRVTWGTCHVGGGTCHYLNLGGNLIDNHRYPSPMPISPKVEQKKVSKSKINITDTILYLADI